MVLKEVKRGVSGTYEIVFVNSEDFEKLLSTIDGTTLKIKSIVKNIR